MERRWAAAVGLIILAGCGDPDEARPEALDEFVGRDLTGLDDASKAEFVRRLPGPLRDRYGAADWLPPKFLHLWRHQRADGSADLILFEGHPINPIPGVSWVAAHFLTPDGRLLSSQEFATGWRINLTGVDYRQDDALGAAVIELQTPPTINGARLRRQVYGVLGSRVGLLRVEDAAGAAVPNPYTVPAKRYGPDPPARTAEEWERALGSADLVEVLEALTCLGGVHRRATDPPSPHTTPESAATAAAIAEARARPGVRAHLGRLAGSAHPWVSEAARGAQARLAD